MSKFVCLKNFTCNDRITPRKGEKVKEGATMPHRHWNEGEEYTGSDDTDRLQEEGLIGTAEAPKAAKGKKGGKGKKKAEQLDEGEAMTTEGDTPTKVTPASGDLGDNEEPADEDEEQDEKPAKPAKGAKGKKSKK